MIIGWTTFKGHSLGDYQRLVNYFAAETAEKRVNTSFILVRRHPSPELLRGGPAHVLTTLGALNHKHRLSAFTLTFSEADIPVRAFNAGDPVLRDTVRRIVDLALEVAFPAVPNDRRPAVLVTTHTHTGKLELNFALPRCVNRADGRVRAHNPSPPGERAHDLWWAFVDTVNAHCGFDDPGNLDHARLIKLPNGIVKQLAEARRNLRRSPYEVLEGFIPAVINEASSILAERGALTRQDLQKAIMPVAKDFGLTFRKSSDFGTTFVFRSEGIERLVTFRGPLMSEECDETVSRWPSWNEERQKILRAAPERLASRWLEMADDVSERHKFAKPDSFEALSEFLEPAPKPARRAFRQKDRGLRPIAGLLHRLVTERLMGGLVARLVTALPENLFAEPHKKLEALNARYTKQHEPSETSGHSGFDRVEPTYRGTHSRSPGAPGNREGARGGRATRSDDRGSRRDLAADRESREYDGRRDRSASPGSAETREARAGDRRSDGPRSRTLAAFGLNELDASIKALLERLGAAQGQGGGKFEDALEPAEIGAPEENDEILPDGP
ncbi:hypothetical protein [Thioclava sp. F28-4]|uniref:hypothetical protein n=1 Tax=Thioclava sp. F28-4 TaxID=1915315 RepID=UPI0011BAAFD1|nr:hypothetical protein [Thioclava sp. F28-4]